MVLDQNVVGVIISIAKDSCKVLTNRASLVAQPFTVENVWAGSVLVFVWPRATYRTREKAIQKLDFPGIFGQKLRLKECDLICLRRTLQIPGKQWETLIWSTDLF